MTVPPGTQHQNDAPPDSPLADSSEASQSRRSAGETLTVPERMIVAPGVGIFRPNSVVEGHEVRAGDEIGIVEGPGTQCPVLSPFGGTLMGMLAHPGERLRSGQPIAWLRVA